MTLDSIGLKDVLDWTMPLILGWVGSGVRKYLKEMKTEMIEAKNSVLHLNVQIAKILERTEAHQREIEDTKRELTTHEKRIRHVEQRVPSRRDKCEPLA